MADQYCTSCTAKDRGLRCTGKLYWDVGTGASIAHMGKCPRVDAAGDLAQTNPGLQDVKEGKSE